MAPENPKRNRCFRRLKIEFKPASLYLKGLELEAVFRELFAFLESVHYVWQTMTPERLQECRQFAESYPPWVQFFGLGVDLSLEQLCLEGMPERLAREVLQLRPAISRMGEFFIAHEHWGTAAGGTSSIKSDYIYYGSETQSLMGSIEPYLDQCAGKSVLDLGSGAGGLSFFLEKKASRVLGIEIQSKAVLWAQASARAQNLDRVRFECAAVGSADAEKAAANQLWDIAVFNPPLALPFGPSERVYRDGGALGVEIPLKFVDFSARHLKKGGEVFCLITNPIVHGRSCFFERLDKRIWIIEKELRLHDHFNHGLYRKENYAAQGIQRVELWFLHLRLKCK